MFDVCDKGLTSRMNHRDVATLGLIAAGFIRAAWIPVSATESTGQYSAKSSPSQISALRNLFDTTIAPQLSGVSSKGQWLLENANIISGSRFVFKEFSKLGANGDTTTVDGYIVYFDVLNPGLHNNAKPSAEFMNFYNSDPRSVQRIVDGFFNMYTSKKDMNIITNDIFGFDQIESLNSSLSKQSIDAYSPKNDDQLYISIGVYPVMNGVAEPAPIVNFKYVDIDPKSVNTLKNFMESIVRSMNAHVKSFGVTKYETKYDCTMSTLNNVVKALSQKHSNSGPTFTDVGIRVFKSHLARALAGPVYKDYEMLINDRSISTYLDWAKKHLEDVRAKSGMQGGDRNRRLLHAPQNRSLSMNNIDRGNNFVLARQQNNQMGRQRNQNADANYEEQQQMMWQQYQQQQQQQQQQQFGPARPVNNPVAQTNQAPPSSYSANDFSLLQPYIDEVKKLLMNDTHFSKISNSPTSTIRTAWLSIVVLLAMNPVTREHVDLDAVYKSMPVADAIKQKIAILSSISALLTRAGQ
jgi:hypothetical protein